MGHLVLRDFIPGRKTSTVLFSFFLKPSLLYLLTAPLQSHLTGKKKQQLCPLLLYWTNDKLYWWVIGLLLWSDDTVWNVRLSLSSSPLYTLSKWTTQTSECHSVLFQHKIRSWLGQIDLLNTTVLCAKIDLYSLHSNICFLNINTSGAGDSEWINHFNVLSL